MPVYRSDDEWQIVVIMNLVKIREAIYEIGVWCARRPLFGNRPRFNRRRSSRQIGTYV